MPCCKKEHDTMSKRIRREGSYSKYKYGVRFSITIDGVRKQFYGKTETKAHDKYLEFLNQKSEEKNQNTHCSFGDYAQKWFKEIKEPTLNAGSRKNYLIYLPKIQNSLLGTMPIDKITPTILNAFFNSLEIKKLKKKTYLKAIINGTFNYAIDNELISKNPMRAIHISEPAADETIKVFDKVDIERIINFARTDDFGAEIITMLYTGLRRGELCALQYSDINMRGKYIKVHQAVSKDEGGYFLNNTTKTKTSRIVPINDELLEILKKQNHKGCIWNGKEFLSPQTFENQYNHFFKRLNESLPNDEKVEYLSPHKMRHTFATYALKGSNNLRSVQELLGHSRSSTTEIYTHLDIEDNRTTILTLNYC